MPLINAIKTVAKPRNGVGAFILQCKRLEFAYCDHGGSSKGMKRFLERVLPKFAKHNPQIECVVYPRPNHHPIVRGTYINGREKVVCVRNKEPLSILKACETLRDSSGYKVGDFKKSKPVTSLNESVRGVYSPYHGPQHQI